MNPGIHTIPPDQYHRDEVADQPTLSASIIHTLLQASPTHARAAHPRLNPDYVKDEEQRFAVGTACHALLLEGRDAVQVVDADSWRTNDAKALRQTALENGQIPLLADQWAELQPVIPVWRERFAAFDCDPPLFQLGTPERTLVWEENGVLCRALADWLHDDYSAIDDLKTTSRYANPDSWTRRTLWDIGADVQAQFYRRGVFALTGSMPDFRFAVAETSPPYEVAVVSLTPAAVALADAKIDAALETWKRCLAEDRWPGYPRRVAYAEPPAYLEAQWLERELREEVAA